MGEPDSKNTLLVDSSELRKVSKRRFLLLATIILLFLCAGGWWFLNAQQKTSIYPNAKLIYSSNRYSEVGWIKLNQLQNSTFTTSDSYFEVLRWFLENNWNPSIPIGVESYRFTREEIISASKPEVRLIYFVNIQKIEPDLTCISQGTYASTVLFDGETIYSSPDYQDAGSEYFYSAPDCPANKTTSN